MAMYPIQCPFCGTVENKSENTVTANQSPKKIIPTKKSRAD